MNDLFAENREKLMVALEGGIIVLTGYARMQRGNDVAAAFEQEANFWWLTGIEEASWWIIIDGTRRKSWLVAPERSTTHVIFDGGLHYEDAQKISGVNDVVSHDKGLSMLRDLSKKHSVVFALGDQPYADYLDFVLNPAPKKLHEHLKRTFMSVRDCRKDIANLRAVKDDREIAALKKSVNLTIDAFEQLKDMILTKKYEYEIDAEFEHFFQIRGASSAYDSVVAAGANSCTLHHMHGRSRIKKNDILLLDIGSRHMGYVADISRTYSTGEPTKRQIAVHGVVQEAHRQIIKLLKPGLLFEEYQRQVNKIMMTGLIELGFAKDMQDVDACRKYFPHAVTHGLGIDAHDSLGSSRVLLADMVLTVEPGIYIPEEKIGVRIEDDILITQTGHTNLSARLSTDLR